MTFTIGRASLAYGPYNIRHSGDRIQFNVDIDQDTTTDPDVARVIRQQLLGIANNRDEPVVPMTWTDDPDFDGFCRIDSVNVDPSTVYLNNGFMRCSVTGERVLNTYAPVRDVLYVASDYGMAHTSDEPYLWFPEAATWVSADNNANGLSRTGSDGEQVNGWLLDSGTGTARYSIPAADAYAAAATIEIQANSTWYPVMGRQLLGDTVTAVNDVRVSNGLLRITYQSDGDMELEAWDGSTWDAIGDFTFTEVGDIYVPVGAPVIFRNGPDVVTVAWGAIQSSGGYEKGHYPVTVSMRRGELVASVGIGFDFALSSLSEFGEKSRAVTSTAFTSGAAGHGGVQSSAGATGHKFTLSASSSAYIFDTSESSLRLVSSTDVGRLVGLGVELSGASSGDQAADIHDQFQAAMSSTERIAAR